MTTMNLNAKGETWGGQRIPPEVEELLRRITSEEDPSPHSTFNATWGVEDKALYEHPPSTSEGPLMEQTYGRTAPPTSRA